MCWRKIIKPEQPMVKTELRYLGFGKNIYGGGNDLTGCVPDVNNRAKKLTSLFSGIDCRVYKDSQALGSTYLNKAGEAINLLDPGSTVVVPMDSCFSGTATRLMGNPFKNRYIDPELKPRATIKTRIFRSGDINWVAMSGCGEHQTCADAVIGGNPVGAYSYYGDMVLRVGMTWREWHEAIRTKLPNEYFDQAPEIEGPDYLLDRRIGEGQTLIIHNSSHGSWTADKDGDETDGRDEGIFFDYLLIDDTIKELLNKIPKAV